jgi:hypothetical protein
VETLDLINACLVKKIFALKFDIIDTQIGTFYLSASGLTVMIYASQA